MLLLNVFAVQGQRGVVVAAGAMLGSLRPAESLAILTLLPTLPRSNEEPATSFEGLASRHGPRSALLELEVHSVAS